MKSFRKHGMLASALAAILVALAVACAVNPATGKRQLSLIGEGQEVELGKQYDQQIVASMGLYGGEELQAWVQRIGEKLAAKSERPDLDWTFRVVDDPAVNAFALPGGYIYVTRGILSHLNNEAELASVIGHEIGHVTARHSVNQMSKAQLAQLGLGLGMVLDPEAFQNFGGLAQTGLGLLFLKYGRDDENQADELGLRYMTRARYDAREMPGVFDVLRRVGDAAGSDRLPGFLSTHPAPENRSEHIRQLLASHEGEYQNATVNRDGYLETIDGIVFGEDPREGYFRGNRFFHPKLEFRVDFPSGWQTRNEKQAVQALSPDNDAIVQLTLTSASSAEQALSKFFDQQGVTPGPPFEDEIGGMRAASRAFSVNTEQGALRGVVAFVEYGDQVYGLLGYAPDTRWQARSDAIRDSLASFQRLTDRKALDVEPQRVAVVRPEQPLSLPTFAERFDATVPVETVALLNHLDSGDRVRANVPYKVVRGGEGWLEASR